MASDSKGSFDLGTIARGLLFVIGLGAIGWLLHTLGPATVARRLLSAGRCLPILLVVEASWMALDVFVLRAILGEKRGLVPNRVYARSALVAYAITALFPLGRAAGELARASILSKYLGAERIALPTIQCHGASMIGTTFITLVSWVVAVATLGASNRLSWVLLGSAALTGALGLVLLLGTRTPWLWARLQRYVKRFATIRLVEPDASASFSRAIAWSFLGRAIQCAFFVTALYAVSGVFSVGSGVLAQGVSISGSTFGDAVPQQMGVSEGAFYYFAGQLGLGATPDKAVAIALLLRVCQIVVAGCCVPIAYLWKER